jgi:hypothetical protein
MAKRPQLFLIKQIKSITINKTKAPMIEPAMIKPRFIRSALCFSYASESPVNFEFNNLDFFILVFFFKTLFQTQTNNK